MEDQIAYGRRRGCPWGISESGYYAFDASQNYQYRAFGVPGLGFKRNLAEDLVVAPYASLLALSFRAAGGRREPRTPDELGALGVYGLYEAVDFTPARLPLGQDHAVVQEYMAHHQGMILVALDNRLQVARLSSASTRTRVCRVWTCCCKEEVPADAPFEFRNVDGTDLAPTRPSATAVSIALPWSVAMPAPRPPSTTFRTGSTAC